MRKANLARLLARRPEGIFVSNFEQGEIGPDLFRAACKSGKASSPSAVIVPTAAPIARLDQGQEPKYPAIERVKEAFA